MKIIFAAILLCFMNFLVLAQEPQAYSIYNSKGKKVKYSKVLQAVNDNPDYVFFGEYHDNPIIHWLQLELLMDLHDKFDNNLVVGFEMFEQDQQKLFDAYLGGQIEEKAFEDSCRLWPNYSTDYEPIVKFMIENKLKGIADNIPRRYASLLFKKGREALDSLTMEEKSWIAPLDFVVDTTLSQYREINKMAMHGGMHNMVEAQAIKDATMAHFMMQEKKDNNVVYHLNGAFHSDFYQGIMWYIQQKQPDAKIVTISTVSQEDVSKLNEEHLGRADFIICVNENMTSTH